MYRFRQVAGGRYVVSIGNHEEVVGALAKFCEEMGIASGSISGIGAVSEAVLRFFEPRTKDYADKRFSEQMEIANLTGNISSMQGNVYLHLHVTLGRSDCSALAGHLLSACVNGACELVVEDFGTKVERVYDPGIGLNCYDL